MKIFRAQLLSDNSRKPNMGAGEFLRQSMLVEGREYLAQDPGGDGSYEHVTILKIVRDKDNMYNITVKLADGKKDTWYIELDDQVFKRV